MDEKLFEFNDLQTWRRSGRYFARYDAEAHQVVMREDEISEDEARWAVQGEGAAMQMLFALQRRLLVLASILTLPIQSRARSTVGHRILRAEPGAATKVTHAGCLSNDNPHLRLRQELVAGVRMVGPLRSSAAAGCTVLCESRLHQGTFTALTGGK